MKETTSGERVGDTVAVLVWAGEAIAGSAVLVRADEDVGSDLGTHLFHLNDLNAFPFRTGGDGDG